ncbi:hypothetical protein [uncultured Sphingomonas sp.]|uniref:hypothetical protein n=1 Tax=uncultured Sphingomonas sp. TaxID=158754 RepID=UPI003747E77F
MVPPSVATNSPRRARAVEWKRGAARSLSLVAAVLGGGAAAPAGDLAYPPDSVLLLVAPWCAPCHAELARLDTIAAAARPQRLRVFMVDDGAGAGAMWRRVPDGYRWTPPAGEERRYRADALARTPGLPFSLATDARGRVCAMRGGGMDAARVAALVGACRRPS